MAASGADFGNLIVSVQSSDREPWGRGRRRRLAQVAEPEPPTSSQNGADTWTAGDRNRNTSPNSVRSGKMLSSSASSTHSHNWRSSMSTTSSAGASTSAFTRYSNSSLRSVSTVATSVSSSSWRAHNKPPPSVTSTSTETPPSVLPPNVKFVTGVPWELGELPRQLHPDPMGVVFSGPPTRNPRFRKPQDTPLQTITERPGIPPAQKAPVFDQLDASVSTTDLADGEGIGPKKVHRGQITTLAKMLSALRR